MENDYLNKLCCNQSPDMQVAQRNRTQHLSQDTQQKSEITSKVLKPRIIKGLNH